MTILENLKGEDDRDTKGIMEASEHYWDRPVSVLIDNLDQQDQIILKDFLILDMRPKQIADRNNWANSTVTWKLNKIMQKLKQFGNNDREETNTIIGLIKKYLSKTDY